MKNIIEIRTAVYFENEDGTRKVYYRFIRANHIVWSEQEKGPWVIYRKYNGSGQWYEVVNTGSSNPIQEVPITIPKIEIAYQRDRLLLEKECNTYSPIIVADDLGLI